MRETNLVSIIGPGTGTAHQKWEGFARREIRQKTKYEPNPTH